MNYHQTLMHFIFELAFRSKASPACQVTESPELTRIVRQLQGSNRAPWQAEKDF
jgi:hypothetical protein